MNRTRAEEILREAAAKRIVVVGDLILDEFLWGKVDRISPEAPVPVVQVTGESWYPGGAANVARNLREFTPHVAIAGFAGADAQGARLRLLLDEQGIDTSGVLTDATRPTIVKTRIIARHQQVVRVDREVSAPPDLAALEGIAGHLRTVRADAVIAADYAKGTLNQKIADVLAGLNTMLTIDPSPLNGIEWRGAAAIKPNRGEAARLCGDAPAEQMGARLLERWDARMILLTLGEDGMMLFERGREPFHTPARAREVFDVSGAGDTAIAIFTLALCAGAAPYEAAELANAASGVVVGKLGTAVLTPGELIEAL
jgi:D-glycero-beta-D-manno-heptose-7-phosphate kinase